MNSLHSDQLVLLIAHVSFRLKRIMQLPVSFHCRFLVDHVILQCVVTAPQSIYSFLTPVSHVEWLYELNEVNITSAYNDVTPSVFVRLFATMTKSALNSLLHDLPWRLTCSGTSPKYNSGVLSVVMSRPVLKSAGLVYDGSVGKSAGELN
jgi:hypothetical protein